MKIKGILFSGTEENVNLAKIHIREHGIVYWSLPVRLKYEEFHFPIIALLHIKGKGVRYKCIISDVMPFDRSHFKYPKKKPAVWISGQKTEKRKYKVTFAISKMTPFYYETNKLKNWEDQSIGNAPQGYARITIPVKIKRKVILIIINKLYYHGISRGELYEVTRGIWKVGIRRYEAKYAFAVFQGIVREVYKISSWHPAGATPMKYRDLSRRDLKGRWEFIGHIASPELRNSYIGKSIRKYIKVGSRNPIRYINI